jgi:lycopene cyclase domain-containing protein
MTGLGYTVPAVASVVAVCAGELAVLRTGLFRKPAYWLTLVIVAGFQILVDGWLTKLSAPIVEYAPRQMTGLRGPWDIPVEDFLFGFALVTSALLLWEWQGQRAKRTARSQRAESVPPGGRPDCGLPDSPRPTSPGDMR